MRRFTYAACAVLAFPAAAQEAVQPEQTFSVAEVERVEASSFMVAAANPLAAQAGYDVLEKGGTAADAMIAVQLMLNLVEPQSSGIGGGAFLVYYDAESGKLTTLDGREKAPASATPEYWLGEDGKPVGWWDAVKGVVARWVSPGRWPCLKVPMNAGANSLGRIVFSLR